MPQPPLSFAQRLVTRFASAQAVARMEHESRQWIATCPEGHRHDIWSLGGIRAGAKGTKTSRLWCPDCGRRRMMLVRFEAAAGPD